jgi:hypothetical protein
MRSLTGLLFKENEMTDPKAQRDEEVRLEADKHWSEQYHQAFIDGAVWADSNPISDSTVSVRLKAMTKLADRVNKENCDLNNAIAQLERGHAERVARLREALENIGAKARSKNTAQSLEDCEIMAKKALKADAAGED